MAEYTMKMSFAVPGEIKAEWKELAKAQGISLSEMIRRAASVDRLGLDGKAS